jgi:hypothetical protein
VTDSQATAGRSCEWCGAVTADPAATTCSGCGAALAVREDLGGLVIPGVTSVDPGLAAYDAQPLRLTRPSPSQGLAGGAVVAAAAGGPVGLAALGGLAAVAAVEYLGAGSGRAGQRTSLDAIGVPSEAARRMVERLNGEADGSVAGPAGAAAAAGAATPGDTVAAGGSATDVAAMDAPATEGGSTEGGQAPA